MKYIHQHLGRVMALIVLLFFTAVVLQTQGCAGLGLPAPQTAAEKIAAAQASVTQVRVTATELLRTRKLSSVDGENVLRSTDAAAEGIAVARTISVQDPAAGQARLTAAVTILTALQAYLADRASK